jgi:hypothetical protein
MFEKEYDSYSIARRLIIAKLPSKIAYAIASEISESRVVYLNNKPVLDRIAWLIRHIDIKTHQLKRRLETLIVLATIAQTIIITLIL